MTPRLTSHLIAIVVLALAAGGCNRNGEQSAQGGGRGAQATAACVGHAAGDACSMTWRDHPVSGTCVAGEQGLRCRPAPRPEALAACVGHAEGAACAMSFNGRDVSGTCTTVPGSGLACHGEWRHGEQQ